MKATSLVHKYRFAVSLSARVGKWVSVTLSVLLSLGAVVLVSAPPASAATAAPSGTRAYIRVLTVAPRAGYAVAFSTYGTHIRRGRHLRKLVLTFGDGTHRAFTRLNSSTNHMYSHPGTFVAVLTVVDSAGAHSSMQHAFAVAGANVVVKKATTRTIAAGSLLAVHPVDLHRQRIHVKSAVPVASVGYAVIIGRGAATPHGLIGIVQSITRHNDGTKTLVLRDAGLSAAYKTLRTAAMSTVGSGLALTHTASNGETRLMAASAMSAVPFTCRDSSGRILSPSGRVQVNADLSHTTIGAVVNLSARVFQVTVISKPVFTLGVTYQGKVECHLSDGFALNFPVPSVPGLVISVAPYFTVLASGAVNASASWSPFVDVDILRSPKMNDNFLDFSSKASAEASGTASTSLEGGLKLSVSVGKQAGLEASLGPKIAVNASVSADGACVDAWSAIEAKVELFAHVFFVDGDVVLYQGSYFLSHLLHRCTPGATTSSDSGASLPGVGSSSPQSIGYQGPVIDETTGSTARSWTDFVHAGGAEGSTIGGNQHVGIACRAIGFKVADGNTWWYRLGSLPWSGNYYVSADAFYNNGATSGSLRGTPFVDTNVPLCDNTAGSAPVQAAPPTTTTPTINGTFSETTGGVAHTWTNYMNAGGTEGTNIASNQTVQIACTVAGFQVDDGNTWWYRIASSPWNNSFYVSADAFYNNGQTSGSLRGTPFVDTTVPTCDGGSGPEANGVAETTGGVAHTWTNYMNAGGTEGTNIASNQTVQIACKVTGFPVADGNTWWYRIASSPWNNSFYASADAFYNNGQTSGSLSGTPFVDPAVRDC
jgi:hypothetical protein